MATLTDKMAALDGKESEAGETAVSGTASPLPLDSLQDMEDSALVELLQQTKCVDGTALTHGCLVPHLPPSLYLQALQFQMYGPALLYRLSLLSFHCRSSNSLCVVENEIFERFLKRLDPRDVQTRGNSYC